MGSSINDNIKNTLMHYGVSILDGAPGPGSGRYPYGSGENPMQHGSGGFIGYVDNLRKGNFTYKDEETGKVYTGDTAIAKSLGLTTTQFRTELSLANAEQRAALVATAESMRQKGYSLNEIAKKMGYANDSSVRALLNENAKARMNKAQETANLIKKEVDKKGIIDVGTGVEKELGISREKLNEALYILQRQGYEVYGGGVPQVTNPGRQTNIKVIGPPGTKWKDMYDYENVHSLRNYESHDQGDTYDPKWVYPKSMDSNRLQIRYGDQGGGKMDGVIEIRRGVPDLSLGDSHYAQVRILVDGTNYLKGLAIYSDDLPKGVDVRFNTNKPSTTPMKTKGDIQGVLKEIKKDDPDNPFGALLKAGINDPSKANGDDFKGGQSYYYDSNGKKQLSLINKTREEGDWSEWSNKLPSQFLSKQTMPLIKKQLSVSVADKEAEYKSIMELNNPTIKKQLLESFSNDCDSAAVNLYASSLPRQRYQVLLPLKNISDKEVYAPNYKDGETVALVRYPHAGTFEIPVLTVNNKNAEGKRVVGNSANDAIGINSTVAHQLSGADFDGDTVMVIPCNSRSSSVKINHRPELEGLKDFDPTMAYGGKPKGSFKELSKPATQIEMGKISNLITDMTVRGAPEKDVVKAVKHSMVVIDANKHELDYRQSEKDQDIASLKKFYQGSYDENGNLHTGAGTILSRAKNEKEVVKSVGSPTIDPKTGELIYKRPPKEYIGKDGKTHVRTEKSTQMAETNNAYTLVSDARAPQELAYAEYANKMKALANQARKEMVNTKDIPYSKSAKSTYTNEVRTLDAKLAIAEKNAPRERQAQLIANARVTAKKNDNPGMDKAEVKKMKQRELTTARTLVGAQRHPVDITPKEYEAIQAGAVAPTKLKRILKNADLDKVRQLATPRKSNNLSDAKIARISGMKAAGYTNAEIAAMLGISTSTVSKYLNK